MMHPVQDLFSLGTFAQDSKRPFAGMILHGEESPAVIDLNDLLALENPSRSHDLTSIFALFDDWQAKGLGRRMLETLIAVARARGLEVMIGHVLATNEPMLGLCVKLGFHLSDYPEDSAVRRAVLDLAAPRSIA